MQSDLGAEVLRIDRVSASLQFSDLQHSDRQDVDRSLAPPPDPLGRGRRGQVVDAAMVEGAAMITSVLHGLRAAGKWRERLGGNLFDGSAPFYATYECADGAYGVAVGARISDPKP
jgi:crotonobetainyl-CoA:carnitine CoA-transferase CaiB-like acyl-CoA transferase